MACGSMIWSIMDPDQMLRYAIFAKNKMYQNVVTILKLIINMGFNYFFSKLAAMTAIHLLAANMFKNFDKVIYQTNDGKLIKSKLWLVDIWSYLKNQKTNNNNVDLTSINTTNKMEDGNQQEY